MLGQPKHSCVHVIIEIGVFDWWWSGRLCVGILIVNRVDDDDDDDSFMLKSKEKKEVTKGNIGHQQIDVHAKQEGNRAIIGKIRRGI